MQVAYETPVLRAGSERAVQDQASDDSYGWISIRNDYMWNGNGTIGGVMSIRIDGKRKGAVDSCEIHRVPVYAGTHTVRVMLQAWYLSPRVTVTVNPGTTVHLRARMPSGRFFSRWVKGMFDPFHWLVLEEIAGPVMGHEASAERVGARAVRDHVSRASYGWISVRNDYEWYGDNRIWGYIGIYINGKRKGSTPSGGTDRVPVYPGTLRCALF
jgi:polygalacturonase